MPPSPKLILTVSPFNRDLTTRRVGFAADSVWAATTVAVIVWVEVSEVTVGVVMVSHSVTGVGTGGGATAYRPSQLYWGKSVIKADMQIEGSVGVSWDIFVGMLGCGR